MAGARSSRLSRDRQGDPARADVYLVVPLAHEATAMRITDTAGSALVRSGAVSPLSDRPGDVFCTTGRSTPATSSVPGTRTSTTATRTTTTRTTSSALAPSADDQPSLPTFPDLVAAYFDCRRTKRNSESALAFEQDLERNLMDSGVNLPREIRYIPAHRRAARGIVAGVIGGLFIWGFVLLTAWALWRVFFN